MAATPDRTTIRAAFEALTDLLRMNLVADPPTSAKPFVSVQVGAPAPTAYARPFLAASLARTRPIGATQGDKILSVTSVLRIVTDVIDDDPHAVLLDKIGAVDDFFDGIADVGIIEGSEGFDDRVWTFDLPLEASGSRVASASAEQSFVVKVERQQNRVPAS